MKPILKIILLIVLFSGLTSLIHSQPNVMIAISKGTSSDSYLAYGRWLTSLDPHVEWVDMSAYTLDSALHILEQCSGLLLSGGDDVFPGRFGKEADTARCDIPDLKRDTLEFALTARADELNLPVLGICRGLQLLNVAYGGSLIIDIPSDRSSTIHKCANKYECFHEVTLDKESNVHRLTGVLTGMTNTNHHQGIDQLASAFRPTGWTPDQLIEVIEWAEPSDKSFLLGVQWHPERMETANPMSGAVGSAFLEASREYYNKHLK